MTQLHFEVIEELRVSPTWVCTGYRRSPKESWTAAQRKEFVVGPTYVRAKTADLARAWCKSARNPLPSWRRVKFVTVKQAHPVHDLGMEEVRREEDVPSASR